MVPLARRAHVKTFTADHFKVALQTLAAKDEPFREDQKTDEFIEIETGSDVLHVRYLQCLTIVPTQKRVQCSTLLQ